MTLGDLVKEYREKNNISMDEFSKICNLSKGYISMLENNTNPRSNKPIAPTLPTIKKIASAINMDIDSILKALDSDQEISLDSEKHMTVGARIKKKREDYGISQTDLAKRIGVSKQSLYKYEMNIVTNIPSNIIEQIAIILHVSPCYLMGWDDKEQQQVDSPKILQYYDQLNDIGQHVATERVKELTEVPRYVKEDPTYVNAAHAKKDATEEEVQHDEDIMDAEDF